MIQRVAIVPWIQFEAANQPNLSAKGQSWVLINQKS
jgi:hypothetical protein